MSDMPTFKWHGRRHYWRATWRRHVLEMGLDSTGWLLLVWAPGFSAAIRVTLPPMPVQQAQKAAEMYVIFGGHYA